MRTQVQGLEKETGENSMFGIGLARSEILGEALQMFGKVGAAGPIALICWPLNLPAMKLADGVDGFDRFGQAIGDQYGKVIRFD